MLAMAHNVQLDGYYLKILAFYQKGIHRKENGRDKKTALSERCSVYYSTSNGSRRIIVSERSGPVEIISTGMPVSSSMRWM